MRSILTMVVAALSLAGLCVTLGAQAQRGTEADDPSHALRALAAGDALAIKYPGPAEDALAIKYPGPASS